MKNLIDEIKEVEAEEKEEVEETEEVEASKEEVQFVSVEQFNTTIDELKALITELKGNTELSEEELEMVAGGGWPITLFKNCFNRYDGCTVNKKTCGDGPGGGSGAPA